MGTKMQKAINYLKEHPVLNLSQAAAIGISRHELKLWVDGGSIKRVGRGLYSLQNATASPQETIAFFTPPCAMAGLSALEHWGYTNYVVREVWVAVPLGRAPSSKEGIHTIIQKPEIFNLGLTTVETPWGPIQVFDREKSVLDGLRGSYLDDEEKFRMLKRWRRDPKRNRKNLGAYAAKIKVKKDFMNWLAFLGAQE